MEASARQITSGDYNHGNPVWSKDGKQLIFSGNLNDDWEYDYRNSEDVFSCILVMAKVKALTDRKWPG